MRRGKSWCVTGLLAVGLTVAGGGGLVYLRRSNIDPRFYRFLESQPGRTVARIMGWSVDFRLPPPDIPEEEMTPQEIAIKRKLEEQIRRDQPRHRLELTNGEVLAGRVVAYSDNTITFLERYGDTGELAMQIRRGRIARLSVQTNHAPRITYRDVQFHRGFPDFEFHRVPPFTAVTDDNFFRVQRSVRLLQRLHEEFLAYFAPLVTRPERGDGIQLLFFEEEEGFRQYSERHAPRLENTSGFYSPRLDRLVVFNQITSDKLRDARRELKRQERLYARQAHTPDQEEQVKIWRSDAARSIARHAERQTEYTVRHEGAHQLFFTYGVHSTHHAENSWLIEGLAVFCEGPRVGDRLDERVAMIRKHLQHDTLIPLGELVNSRSALGLFVFGNEERVHLAYAEAWATVQFLMLPRHRERFFEYIRMVRDPASIDTLSAQPRINLLAQALDLSPGDLDRQWRLHLQRL